ncbi:MAG: Fic family protein [Methylocella sp.]
MFPEASWHWLSQSNNRKFLALVAAVAAAVLWLVHQRIPKNVHGPEHPDLAAGFNNLAKLFREKATGIERPNVALGLNANWSDHASMEPMQAALIDSIEEKKAQLLKHFDMELTGTSSAINWNRLTLRENDDYLEYRAIMRGSNLGYLIDAENHAMAAHWMRKLAVKATPVDENIERKLHRRVFACERHKFGGVYRSGTTGITERGRLSPVIFPEPVKVPALMDEFGAWLREAPPGPASAFEAHFRLVAIHPFEDGNGRVARLLMNLLLIRGGYPPVPMWRENRKTYLDSLRHSSLTGDFMPYRVLMYQRLDETLGEYLSSLQ